MKMSFAAALLVACVALAACTDESIKVQKSPCVGIEGSPCGPKRVPLGNGQA